MAYCHPASLTYMQSTSCEMPGWMKHKLDLRLPISITSDINNLRYAETWRNINNLRYADDTTLIAESEDELKSLFFNFLLFYIFILFYFILFLLYNTVLVLPYIDMSPPQVYMSSQSWTRLPHPAHIISLGHPSAPAPSILYPVWNLDWWLVSYMIVYMFQCHSPKSSHPLPLPQNPKVCSIHLCLFCCLAYRVIITIFLNSIYMC